METWKVIPNFENYEASNTGQIRKAKTGYIKPQQIDNRGYKVITLWMSGKKYCKKVARLVWAAFNGCDCGLTVDHIDQDKFNNNLANLRCISNKDNCNNRTIYNRHTSNKYNLTDEIRGEIMHKLVHEKTTTHKIWKDYGIPTNYMGSVIKRGTWLKFMNGVNNVQEIPTVS